MKIVSGLLLWCFVMLCSVQTIQAQEFEITRFSHHYFNNPAPPCTDDARNITSSVYLRLRLNNPSTDTVFVPIMGEMSELNALKSDTSFTDTLVVIPNAQFNYLTISLPNYLAQGDEYNFQVTITANYNGNTLSDVETEEYAYGSAQCGLIGGQVFIDKNNNCIFDGNDEAVEGQIIQINHKQNYYYTTDNNGYYEYLLPFGDKAYITAPVYAYKPDMSGYNKLICSNQKITASYIQNDSTNTNFSHNFPYIDRDTVESKPVFTDYSLIPTICSDTGKTAHIGVLVGSLQHQKTATIHFGDGNTKVLPIVTSSSFVFGSHDYDFGTYHPYLIVEGINRRDSFAVGTIVVSDTCGTLSGKVYLDANSNCVKDSADSYLSDMVVEGQLGNQKALHSVSQNGSYGFPWQIGDDYELSIKNSENGIITSGKYAGQQVCPVSHTGNTGSSDLDFGISCNQYDLECFAVVGPNRPNFEAKHQLIIRNVGCFDIENAVVTYQLNSKETFEEASIPPSSISGNKLIWNQMDIAATDQMNIKVTTRIFVTAQPGDTLCREVSSSHPSDVWVDNNTYQVCSEVTNSYDPNDIRNFIDGTETTVGAYEPNEVFDYTIRFQNTGTDTAFTVVIVDSISDLLNLSSLEIISSSHSVKTYLSEDRILRFEFQNILLPDSTTNLAASQGYVSYRILPNQDVQIGEEIKNTAHIYFDFNEAIVTNTSNNYLADPTSIYESTNDLTFLCYPNPAKNDLFVKLPGKNLLITYQMFDLTGKQVINGKLRSGESIKLDQLSRGSYFLKAEADDRIFNRKIVVQ